MIDGVLLIEAAIHTHKVDPINKTNRFARHLSPMISDHAPIWEALERVVDPCSIATGVPISVVKMGMVKHVDFDDEGVAHVLLRLTSPICWQASNIVEMVETVLAKLPSVTKAVCTLDPKSDWMPDMVDPEARRRLRLVRPISTKPR
jgi:metal-sulfur cluster biosynthetic enzyme